MSRTPAEHQVCFSVSQVVAWAPGVITAGEWHDWARGDRSIERLGEPGLQQMPPMLRRHAGRLGRLACYPAYETLGDLRDVPMVFSARYGEVSRSVELLTALSAGDELSPTTFGLSVHNSVPGLFSMARKETANSISVAACNDAAEFGVIEACGLLADGAEQVLLVVADCPLPDIYQQFEDTQPIAFGWSCILSNPDADVVCLSWRDSADSCVIDQDRAPDALAALPVLLGVSTDVIRCSAFGQNVLSDSTAVDSARSDITKFGQNVSSDPTLVDSARRATAKFGQNVSSDPTMRDAERSAQPNFGQNVSSDPTLSDPARRDLPQFGQKVTSDPKLSDAKVHHPTHRIWRWTRNA